MVYVVDDENGDIFGYIFSTFTVETTPVERILFCES
jgi:hypothetical protein